VAALLEQHGLVGRHDRCHESHPVGLGGLDEPLGEDHLDGTAGADQPGQPLRPPAPGSLASSPAA